MWALAGFLVAGVLIGQGLAQSVVPFPRDYKGSLVKYAVVDRSDGLSRDLYVSRDAMDAVKRDPRLKESIQPGSGSQNWAFGGFDPLTTEPLKLQLPGDCLLCHQAAVVSDMAFSMSLLKRFAETGAVQYGYCSHPGLQACVFP